MIRLLVFVGVIAVCVVFLLGGCTVLPVSADHPLGTAYLEIQDGPDGCHVKASGGMEAKGVNLKASLCGGKDKVAGNADDLSGKEVQLDALDKWASLSLQQQQTAIRLAEDALKVGGPLACAGILTAVGFPAATPFCAALAGVQVPAAPALYEGPNGHVRTLLDTPAPGLVRYRSEGGREHVIQAAEWQAWVRRPL